MVNNFLNEIEINFYCIFKNVLKFLSISSANNFLFLLQVPSEMGNKPSVSEGEDDSDDRTSNSLKGAKSIGSEIANGAAGGEEPEEDFELPPPMKPIQEPLLVTAPPPLVSGVAEIEDKRVSIIRSILNC